MPKVLKKDVLYAYIGLAFDETEERDVREAALCGAFSIVAQGGKLVKYTDQRPKVHDPKELKNLPLSTIKDMTGLAYTVILKKLGKDSPSMQHLLKNAINQLSEHELKLEWEAICDGTVSTIVETMMNISGQPDEVKQDIVNLFEGLAVPYFRDYKGKVPKEDLEWAHKQVKDFFQNIKDRKLLDKNEPQKKLPKSRKALPAG